MYLDSKFWGGVLIVAGTTIGAGMMALPIISAEPGFFVSSYITLFMWAFMVIMALISLEINLYFGKGVTISYMAEQELGGFGKAISSFAIMVLFYALLGAYIAGGSSIASTMIPQMSELPKHYAILSFAAIFGLVITYSTGMVDYSNRLMMAAKVVLFITLVSILLPHVQIELINQANIESNSRWFAILPIFFTSFGFHGSIPTIVNYIGPDKRKLSMIFFIGSLLPVVIYLIWNIITLGTLPFQGEYSFGNVMEQGGDVGVFIQQMKGAIGDSRLTMAIQSFTFIAIVTSFLGVGISLFDFFTEQFSSEEKKLNRAVCGIITLLPPLLFALFYPQGFVMALGYASIALVILAIFIPSLVAWKLLNKDIEDKPKIAGGKLTLFLAFLTGAVIIVIEFI